MKIEKMPEGYLLARKGGNGCELWRKFNGAESMACDAIDELIAERDALRAKIEAMEQQEPVATVRINAINGNPSVDFVPGHHYLHHNDRLYLAPGAKGE